ncbi:uroporphyrinogen-III synthase [uncultured Brevibacterium sp.]|uniref:uroporphyrinogen-III synthase n=1 Tax=uncultured Brevibacterium sp. TaxID=189678 RepID=UPI0025F7879F|nr:uroporphyrinogen-III synthase [uncultured Brevibacterium sp.]
MSASTVFPLIPQKPLVVFMGTGPGDPGLLPVRSADILASAQVVVYDPAFHTDIVDTYAPSQTARVEESSLGQTASTRGRKMGELAKEHGLVVRLYAGDGVLFSALNSEGVAVRRTGTGIEVVPGVGLSAAVASFTGTPITTNRVRSLRFVEAGEMTHTDVSKHRNTAHVLSGDSENTVAAIRSLLDDGWDPATRVLAVVRVSRVRQVSVDTTLGALEQRLENEPVPQETIVTILGAGIEDRGPLSWFETKPLFGWNVLIPRTREQGEITAHVLHEYGAESEVVPTIAIQPPRTPGQMERAMRGLVDGDYQWVGFTSINAVRAVRVLLGDLGLDVRSLAGVRVAAVGAQTAAALREWGIEPELVATTEESARGLAADWPVFDDVEGFNRVLLPRADIATEVLVNGLQEKGWKVDDVTAYRTVRAAPPPAPTREAIKRGDFDAVLFTSSSTVRNLVGIAGKPPATTVVACIGPATAQTAESHGLVVDIVSQEANVKSLIEDLAEYARDLRDRAEAQGEPALRPSERRRTRRKS